MTPLVSIIITAYNQENFLAEAIQSVVNQTYENWECIIIDDGSTDKTYELCKHFIQTESRISYHFQSNQGVSVARNNGFERSKGAFFQFLDGDDFIHENKISTQVELMIKDNSIDVSYTGHKHFFQKNNQTIGYSFKELKGEVLSEMLFEYDNGVSIPIHTALFRREIFDSHELPFDSNYKFRYEDWVFWVNIALKGAKFSFVNYPYAFYRIHDNNFCNNENETTKNAILAMYRIAEKLDDKLKILFLTKRTEFFVERVCRKNIENLSLKHIMKLGLRKSIENIKYIIRKKIRNKSYL